MKKNTTKSIKTLAKTIIALSSVAVIASPASARDYNNQSNHSSINYAQVVNVKPVIEKYQVNNPVEQCWDEQVQVNRRNHNTRTPEILGGLIGAALGHNVGNGRGQDVATVAGAVLGASVGRDIKKNTQSRHGATYQVVQRCEVRNSYTTQEQIVGYDVAYRYNGEVFHTHMNQHPGKRIKVRVTVNPV